MRRIDIFLVEQGLVESREQAKRLILAGAVTVNGTTRIKPGQRVSADAKVVVQAPQRYVSRGGFKLEKALSLFDVDVENRVALDVGASTGGFTDCLLQHGAKFVYAVDVGYGQLAWKLRTHPQVQSIEKTNIRHLPPTHLSRGELTSLLNDSDDFISIAVIDVSFISLRTVLPKVIQLLRHQEKERKNGRREERKEGHAAFQPSNQVPSNFPTFHPDSFQSLDIIALLKPQFEAGKVHVKKGGIVADKQVHIETIENLSVFVTDKLGVTVRGLTYSPIHKDIGNIEYLLWLTLARASEKVVYPQQTAAEVVKEAHEAFET